MTMQRFARFNAVKVMSVWGRVGRWLGAEPVEYVDDAALDSVYERRFQSTDRARFNRLWREIARIVRVSPLQLDDSDLLESLAQSASRFSCTTMEQLADLVSEESSGVPTRALTTVGDLADWMLANPR